MGLFTKRIGPVFFKESNSAQIFINRMQELQQRATGELKQKIEKQINLAKYGAIGEQNIAFELQNSGMDMYVLHDIYLEAGGLTAQIDYIVITRQSIYVIECKNLIGNIEIDNAGAFIRSYEMYGRRIKEGIYSPITQNQRHLQVLKAVRLSAKTNFLTKMLFEKNFADTYKSVVVLANPKTYLNAKFAKKEIKEQVIRADQLITYIRNNDAKQAAQCANMSSNEMLELAQFYLAHDNPQRSDYARKYEEMLMEINGQQQQQYVQYSKPEQSSVISATQVKTNLATSGNREDLVQKLKAFRLEQSRKENIKPYYIFNDAQMNDLLDKNPRDRQEMLKVSGFGTVKVEKYGDIILQILHG